MWMLSGGMVRLAEKREVNKALWGQPNTRELRVGSNGKQRKQETRTMLQARVGFSQQLDSLFIIFLKSRTLFNDF